MTYATNINTNCCSLEYSQYYERVIFNNPGLLRVQTGKGKLRFDKRRVDAHVRLLFFIEHYSQSVGDIECIDRNLEKHCPSVCSRYLQWPFQAKISPYSKSGICTEYPSPGQKKKKTWILAFHGSITRAYRLRPETCSLSFWTFFWSNWYQGRRIPEAAGFDWLA